MFNETDILDHLTHWYFEQNQEIFSCPKIEKYKKAELNAYENLLNALSKDQKALMEDFENAFLSTQGEIEDVVFKAGIKTGIKLVCAAFSKG